MRTYDKFYINGQWVEPIGKGTSEVINPANGEISATVPYGNAEDVDAAVRRPEMRLIPGLRLLLLKERIFEKTGGRR